MESDGWPPSFTSGALGSSQHEFSREPLEVRKARLQACYADACRACASTSTCRILATWCIGTPARWGWKASSRSGSARAMSRAGPVTG